MLVLEKDAREKYCPTGGFSNCLASECMWWRWNPSESNRRQFFSAEQVDAVMEPAGRRMLVKADWTWVPYNEEDGEPAGWLEPQASVDARRLGFCGAAVRPFED